MVQSLQLGSSNQGVGEGGMRRLNRLPIIATIVFIVLFIGVVVIGLSWRGLSFNRGNDIDSASNSPATSFGDQLKRGVGDGIIGDPQEREVFQPAPGPAVSPPTETKAQVPERPATVDRIPPRAPLESEEEWKARLKREQDEQYLREQNRQRMARLQAQATALDSPLKVDVSEVQRDGKASAPANAPSSSTASGSDLYAAAINAGLRGQNVDPNGQASKEDFFNQDIKDLGYLPNRVVPQLSRYELKRGSVIPATLITGLNSDLPGRISAQVSQNVYDSATGYRLLIPQGAKLFGRYDRRFHSGRNGFWLSGLT